LDMRHETRDVRQGQETQRRLDARWVSGVSLERGFSRQRCLSSNVQATK
jgi:hypothetical protein